MLLHLHPLHSIIVCPDLTVTLVSRAATRYATLDLFSNRTINAVFADVNIAKTNVAKTNVWANMLFKHLLPNLCGKCQE